MILFASVFGCKEPEPIIEVTAIQLSASSISLVVGSSRELTAKVKPENATDASLVWDSSDPAVASVSKEGVVNALTPGHADITVTASNSVSAKCEITVTAAVVPVTGVSLDQTEASVEEKKTITLAATVTPSDATNKEVVWNCDKKNIAVVVDGVVRGITPGITVVTATTVDGGFKASCTVTVTPEPIPVTGIKLDKTSTSVTEGNTVVIRADILPSNATDKAVIWESDATDICTVSAGVVTALKPGEANITATSHDGGFSVTCAVTVLKKANIVDKDGNAEGFDDITGNYMWN